MKKAVSVTLSEENLVWLQGRVRSSRGTLSGVVDGLIANARAGGRGTPVPARSVVGTIDLAANDAELALADAAIRDLFTRSVTRPLVTGEQALAYAGRAGRKSGRRG
jgi:hypothetical protein